MVLKRIKELSECVHWQIRKEFELEENIPSIMDPWDSMMDLIDSPGRSVARLADGELRLMADIGTPTSKYQNQNKDLSNRLKDVLRCDKKNCRVALPKWMIYWSGMQPPMADSFVVEQFNPSCKKGNYFKYFKSDYLYYDSCLSVPKGHYANWGTDFIKEYYYLVKKFLTGRDIILVTGDNRYKTMEYRLLAETSKSTAVVSVPSKNAWASYDKTLEELRKANKDGSKLVVACCGPAATVLAYDLCDEMQVFDAGHLLVDYNCANNGSGTGSFWS